MLELFFRMLEVFFRMLEMFFRMLEMFFNNHPSGRHNFCVSRSNYIFLNAEKGDFTKFSALPDFP
jgi:hypothetical protein